MHDPLTHCFPAKESEISRISRKKGAPEIAESIGSEFRSWWDN